MPWKPKKPCSYPGCPELTQGKYCDVHRAKEEKRERKERDNDFYSSRGWRKKRLAYLKKHPICSIPGCGQPATEVDHKRPRNQGGTDDEENLDSKCKPHHSRKTIKEVMGRGD